MPTIIDLVIPEHHSDPHWAAYQRLGREHNHELIGGSQWDTTDETALAKAAAEDEQLIFRFLALEGQEPVGFALAYTHLLDSPDELTVSIYVTPTRRGRGIATALAQRLQQVIEERKPKVVTSWHHMTPIAHGEVLQPASGHGAVPADHPGVRLALKHGFALAQVERVSRYDFANPSIDPQQAAATAAAIAGDDYETICWEGATPANIIDGVAVLKQRMSTDVPSGDLVVAETSWDVDRVRRLDAKVQQSYRTWRAVVRHRPTQQVVALSEVLAPLCNPDAFLEQRDTIVLPEHRGRRLGMLVKAANLCQIKETFPQAGAIVTWNAEENRHMLAVNEALGFTPILVEGAFQRVLEEDEA